MYTKVLQWVLITLEALVALTALAGGIGLMTGAIQFPAAWVQAMPFGNPAIPGLILALIVGGSALAAVWLAMISHTWRWLVSLAAGFFLICFEIVEVVVEPQIVWLQPLFFGVGVVIIALTILLWRAETQRVAPTTYIREDERQPVARA